MLKDVDELQVECSILHRKVSVGWGQVLDLATTRNPGLPFIAPETREAAAREAVKFKRDRLIAAAAGYPDMIGYSSRMPGNPAVWELTAEIPTVLVDIIGRITRAQFKTGVCVVRRLRVVEPRPTLLANVRELIWEIPTRTCGEQVQRDLTYLTAKITRLVDGEDRTVLDTTCPHCGHHSLVVYLEAGVIACERPRDADGTRPSCICAQAVCQCRADPAYRHTWIRDSRDPTGSWEALSNRLSIHRRAKEPS